MNNRIIILSVFLPASSCSHNPGIGISANVITSLSDVDDVTIGFDWLTEPSSSGVCSSIGGELNDVLRTKPRLLVSCVTVGAVPYAVLTCVTAGVVSYVVLIDLETKKESNACKLGKEIIHDLCTTDR